MALEWTLLLLEAPVAHISVWELGTSVEGLTSQSKDTNEQSERCHSDEQQRKSLRFHAHILKYSKVMNRRGEVHPRTQEGYETRTEAHEESTERETSTKKEGACGAFTLSPDSLPGRGSLNMQICDVYY